MSWRNFDWAGFLTNFIAVVLGIAITFGGEELISSWHDRNEARESLQLVAEELRDNLAMLQYADSVVQKNQEAGDFMLRYFGRYDEAPDASFAMHYNVVASYGKLSASTDALELMKSSNIFIEIDDQELSLDIIHAYVALKQMMDFYSYLVDEKEADQNALMASETYKKVMDLRKGNDEKTRRDVIFASRECQKLITDLENDTQGFDIAETDTMINKALKGIEEFN